MKANELKTVACYGAGTIGGGLAAYYALKGLNVNVYVRSEASAERAEKAIHAPLDSFVRNGVIPPQEKQTIRDRIRITTDPVQAFRDVLFVQENGAENLEQKHQMIAVMEQYAPKDAVIASSSSGMSVTKIAAGAKHPERILVAHPWNPAHYIPLIEICLGEKTSQAAIEFAVEFYNAVGKEPIVMKKEKLGFVANRLAHALWREQLALVYEGVCTFEDADRAICYGPGLRWGIMGPALAYELGGGEEGLVGCIKKFGAMTDAVFGDISNMTKVPSDCIDLAAREMPPYLERLPDHIGHTHAEIAAYRDQMLVNLLKLHGKL